MIGPLLTATIDGRTLRYAVAGSPEARNLLVLIHGFPLGVQMWEPQVRAIERSVPGWRILVPALSGFDGSDLEPEASMDAYARQTLGLMALHQADTTAVCGLSMGGYVAFAVIRQQPARVQRLVLADTRSAGDTEEGRAARRRLIGVLTREGVDAVAADVLPKLLGRTSQASRPELAAQLREMIGRQPPAAIEGAIRALMSRPDATPQLPSIGVPTLILVGDEDTLTPPAESEQMHAMIPGSRLVRIPGAGHLSNMENPEAFNEALREFLG